jgi:uncharacterized membrane protein
MKSDRFVIGSVVLLAAGLALLFGFTSGSTGFTLGYPFSNTKLYLDITTTGLPALAGVPLVAAGALLLFLALIAAIASLFRGPESHGVSDLPSKRQEPFDFEE